MPKIAHVISSPGTLGGAEKVLSALVRGGHERGWEQLVLNPFAYEGINPELSLAVAPAAYRWRSGRSWSDVVRHRNWVKGELDIFDADIEHVHLFHALSIVSSIPRSARRKRLLTHHHGDFLYRQRRWAEVVVDRSLGKRFDRVVAVSSSVSRFLQETYRYSAESVEVIRNGWEGSPMVESRLSPGTSILTIGHLRVEKGHDVLLRAFARVLEVAPGATLTIVGEGSQRNNLARLSQELGIDTQVTLAGSTTDIWSFLARSTLFVFPSLSEPLGIAVMEAMAAGIPVIASDVGGIPEIVKAGVTGELVAPGDERALAKRIVDLLGSPSRRESLRQAALEAVAEFRMETTVNEYFDLYQRMSALP